MMAKKLVVGPFPGQQVKIEYRPAKWQGEEDRVIIHQVKWAEGWK